MQCEDNCAKANPLATPSVPSLPSPTAKQLDNELLHALVAKSMDGITLYDAAGTILYANPPCRHLLGYDPETEFIGRNIFEFLHPEELDHIKQLFQKCLDNPGKEIRTEVRFLHKSGCWRLFDGLGVNHLNEPNVNAIVCNFRDITEQRELQLQLQQAQKMQAVGRLAGGVAHDFNNLLTIINGYSEILLSELPTGGEHADMLHEIRTAGERAVALTNQLLAISRHHSHHRRWFDVNERVRDVEKLLRRLLGEDIILTTMLSESPLPIKADPGQFEQTIINLAVNARDAMPQGGQLTIRTQRVNRKECHIPKAGDTDPDEYVLLTVTDSGSGIDQDTLAHIFDPFFTTKEIGQGTGLGLFTVYGFVQQSGGFIAVDSQLGAGTTFHIHLPHAGEQSDLQAPISHSLPPAAGTETILLVEDDPPVRRLAALALQSYGYTALQAADGTAALRLAEQYPGSIDLLLVDVVMPEISGQQIAEQIRRRRPAIGVLYMSGYTAEAVLRHGIREEEVNFLQKPFSPAQLAGKVREVLDQVGVG